MKAETGKLSYQISWPPALFVLATLGVAWLYLQSVGAHRFATEADTALIKPVVYLLTALAPFVLLTCVRRVADGAFERDTLPAASLWVLLSVPVALGGIFTLGFAPTAVFGSFALTFVLSRRNAGLSLMAALVAGAIVVVLFRYILDVRIPLWPVWM